MMNEITEANFGEFFFDVRTNKPKPGQVIAVYNSIVELMDCDLKRKVIECLAKEKDGAKAASSLLTKFGKAQPEESYRICKEMTEDMLSGMSPGSVANKCYKYQIELFFYTMPEYIPEDPKWSSMPIEE